MDSSKEIVGWRVDVMAECGLCSMLRAACSRLAKTDEERSVCEKLVEGLSKNEYEVDVFLQKMGESVGVTEEQVMKAMKKELDMSGEEKK